MRKVITEEKPAFERYLVTLSNGLAKENVFKEENRQTANFLQFMDYLYILIDVVNVQNDKALISS